MRPRLFTLPIVLIGALGLAACGYTPGERAVSGGLLGAGAGAGVGAITGGSPITGALIGAGVGAVGGAVTAPQPASYEQPRRNRGYRSNY